MKFNEEHFERWINEIDVYLHLDNPTNVLKFSLAYTLQSLRHGEDLKRFKWSDKEWKV